MDGRGPGNAPEPGFDTPADEGGDAPCWAHLLEDLRECTGSAGHERANDAE